MLFRVLAAALTVAALAPLLWPLLRRGRATPAPRADYDIAVYRAQLRELERDLGRGAVDDGAAAAARLEIERRLLAADAARDAAEPAADAGNGAAGRAPHAAAAAAIAVGLPLAALLLYAGLGAPGLPDQPLAGRDPAPGTVAVAAAAEAELARLRRQLESAPQDVQRWMRLGRLLTELGRTGQALEAWRWARRFGGDRPDIAAAHGEALVAAAGGTVTAAALAAFRAAHRADPAAPGARYYLALADYQAGRHEAAVEAWTALAADAPADAPWRAGLLARVRAAAAELGRDADGLPARAARADPDPRGRGAATVPLSAGERRSIIRAMADGIAARLAGAPDDPDGWLRLGHARAVLGEYDSAAGAYGRAAALAPGNRSVRRVRADAARAAGDPDAGPPEDPLARMEAVLEDDPGDVDALWIVGLGRIDAGDAAAALALWERLSARLPTDDPDRALVRRTLAALREAAG